MQRADNRGIGAKFVLYRQTLLTESHQRSTMSLHVAWPISVGLYRR